MTECFDWISFTPASAEAELVRLLEEGERAVAALESSSPATYEDFVWRLDEATDGLWHCWGRVGHMLSVMNSDEWRRLQNAWQGKIVAFSLRVSQSPDLYRTARALLPGLTGVRRRIVAKMVQSAELAGVGLVGERRERFNAIQARLAQLGTDFHNAVLDATAAFKYEKDGKAYTIDDANYPETMKHCADREVRERLYRARVARAPENGVRIDEILKLRAEAAAILGFANYAEFSLATKCAPGLKAVRAMIAKLDEATVAVAAAEERELSSEPLDPWDRAYFAERLRERKYAYSEEELKRHFEFADVLAGLFRMTKFLFGVDVVELSGDARPPVWHDDVRFFEVRENGAAIAHFYFDPYVRNGLKGGGAWMNEFQNRSWARSSGILGQGPSSNVERPDTRRLKLPLAVVVTNFPTPDADGKCFLPFREVETLFHEFGHALQCMLTRVDEEDAAGINLVEWDAVEVASQFMENWCLDDRTGIVVPDELKRKVRAAKNFRAATACRRQLAFAKLDLDLHAAATEGVPPVGATAAGTVCPNALKDEVFAHFGLPTVPEDLFLNAFTHIFAGGYAAGYYGYKWAEVMSADCYGAFEEAGLADDAKVAGLGVAYRETILGLGGSESAIDVFRRFRGRDPEIGALLRQQGIEVKGAEE